MTVSGAILPGWNLAAAAALARLNAMTAASRSADADCAQVEKWVSWTTAECARRRASVVAPAAGIWVMMTRGNRSRASLQVCRSASSRIGGKLSRVFVCYRLLLR